MVLPYPFRSRRAVPPRRLRTSRKVGERFLFNVPILIARKTSLNGRQLWCLVTTTSSVRQDRNQAPSLSLKSMDRVRWDPSPLDLIQVLALSLHPLADRTRRGEYSVSDVDERALESRISSLNGTIANGPSWVLSKERSHFGLVVSNFWVNQIDLDRPWLSLVVRTGRTRYSDHP